MTEADRRGARKSLAFGIRRYNLWQGWLFMLCKRAGYGLLCGAGVSLALLGLLAGFVPQREGPEVRRRVNLTVAELRPEEIPLPILNAEKGGWAVRGPVSPQHEEALLPQVVDEGSAEVGQWISFLDTGVSLSTLNGPKAVEADILAASFVPVLPLDGEGVALATAQPVDYGESLTIDGQPLRWVAAQDDGARRLDPECDILRTPLFPSQERVLALLPSFNAEDSFARARRYKDYVAQASQRFGLSEALLYAIIHTESNFSPVLVSSQSAMGLMQLLPSTAGGEVHTYLHGHPAKMSLAELSNPEINIRFGAAYLHLLLTRHLGAIKDQRSREYCALAAYNMGPNRFLNYFSPNKAEAIAIINSLQPDELYQRLTTRLPIYETRSYVAKVTRRRGEFENFQ